jgi:hypothetical protein
MIIYSACMQRPRVTRGSFTPGGHAFDAAMQEEAWAFLAEAL